MNSDYDEVAELLQKEGVNIVATDKNNRTPLHHACSVGNERIVGLLIQKSAEFLVPVMQRNFINLTDGNEVRITIIVVMLILMLICLLYYLLLLSSMLALQNMIFMLLLL